MGKNKRKADEDPEEMEEKIKELEARLNRKKKKLAKVCNDAGPSQLQTRMYTPEPVIELEPQSGESECRNDEPEIPAPDESLPEEILLALGDEGKINQEKGDNIRPELVNRWSNIMIHGIQKENWTKLLNKYTTPGNFPMATAPKLNTELTAALSENTLKRDKKFEYRQNLVGKVLSCMGSMLTDIMKGNLNSVKLIEGINDSAKILCNVNHYDNIVRRHFALSSLQNCVKKAVANVTVDTYLFGENLGERLKSAKALERNGSLLQANPATAKKQFPKGTNTFKSNLNWKGPSQKLQQKETKMRGGPRYQQFQHQYQQQNQHRRPASKYHQSRSIRRR